MHPHYDTAPPDVSGHGAKIVKDLSHPEPVEGLLLPFRQSVSTAAQGPEPVDGRFFAAIPHPLFTNQLTIPPTSITQVPLTLRTAG